jgi:NifU-like protein involved in Fe-S cluster formation
MDHFVNPRNAGAMESPDGTGKAANAIDGDMVILRIKVKDGRISEVKHQVFGCAAAIAGSSAYSEMIMGKGLDEALSISKQDVADYLGGLPEGKIGCSILGPDALKEAVTDLRCRQKDIEVPSSVQHL